MKAYSSPDYRNVTATIDQHLAMQVASILVTFTKSRMPRVPPSGHPGIQIQSRTEKRFGIESVWKRLIPGCKKRPPVINRVDKTLSAQL